MRKTARPYLAALLFGALLIPPGPLASQASAKPSVAFLVALQTEALARNAFGAPLPGSSLDLNAARPQQPAAKPAPSTPADQATPRGDGVAVAVKPRSAQPAKKPAYHIVASGDTLWSVARRYGTSVGALARTNGVSEAAILQLGQRLAVDRGTAAARPSAARPAASRQSSTITVRAGQTLSDIAQANGVSTRALVEANGLRSAHVIRAGQRLIIPGRAAAAAPRTRAVGLAPRVPAPAASRPLANSLRRGFLLWPARGVITSRFGMRWRRHHNGMDIAAPRGTPIYAARGGRVSFAGWYYGYGLTVIIDHGGGITSIYGHASSLLVRGGQAVSAGQQIARVGCTGSCTGNHVHFEVRVNGRPVNPLRYL